MNAMSLPSFTPPPLILKVSQLDHVPGRPLHHKGGVLSPDDVRNDALYQKLALDNQRMQKHRGWLAIMVLALAGLLIGGLSLRQSRVPVPALQLAETPPAAAIPALQATLLAPVGVVQPRAAIGDVQPQSSPLDAEIAARMKNIADMEARLKAIHENQKTPAPAGVLTVVPRMAITAPAPAPAATVKAPATISLQPSQSVAQTSTASPVTSAPAALAAIKIVDFFGQNKAVMISISGGDAERTYRVGDVLPGGETITGINSQLGQMQTSKRTINK